VTKNKVAPPFREAQFDIMYNEGVSRLGDLLDMAVEHEVVDKRGAYFFFNEERLGQGRDNAKEALKGQPEKAAEIEHRLRDKLGLRQRDSMVPAAQMPPPAAAREPRGKGAAAQSTPTAQAELLTAEE